MADIDLSKFPYYDDFDPAKNFIKILAIPDRVEQNREFNQIQSIFLDMLTRLGNVLLKNGSIVEGCSIITNNNVATITPGKIYFNGVIFATALTTLTLSGVGEEFIGVKVLDEIITEAEDLSLRDPATGFINYSEPGAHRLKRTISFVLNDSSAAPVFRFLDGQLVLEMKPEISKVNELLAKRTFDQSGNYVVSGMDLSCEPFDINYADLIIKSGKSYVQGFEVSKIADWRVKIAKCSETRDVLSEPKVFVTGTSDYLLNYNYVKNISRVSATVQTTSTINRGASAGGSDILPSRPVLEIVSVTRGGTTYVANTDYRLTGDSVDWSLAGAEPSAGMTYTVVYKYIKTMVLDTDYTLHSSGPNSYLRFLAADLPVNSSSLYVDYSFYLARRDLIFLDANGNFIVKQGIPDVPWLASAPIYADNSLLLLGEVYMPPNSTSGIASSFAVKGVSMGDMQKIMSRLDALEYNQAHTDLDNLAMDGHSLSELKGILTDGFIGLTKADIFHPQYNAAMDLEAGELTLPYTTASVPISFSNVDSNLHVFNRNVTSPFTEVVGLTQPYASGPYLINPYSIFQENPLLKIYPSKDNWVSDVLDIGGLQSVPTLDLFRWWMHDDWTSRGWENVSNWNVYQQRSQDWSITDPYSQDLSAPWVNQVESSRREVISRMILDQSIMYMRPRTVTVYAENFPPADNLLVTFDGTPVVPSPFGGTVSGTAPNSLRTNSTGVLNFTFTIPTGIPCGTKTVKISNGTVTGTTQYTAFNRAQKIEDGVLSVKSTLTQTTPISQVFNFLDSRLITSMDLFFSYKDVAETSPVLVQIRDVVNGLPGTSCLGEVLLAPSQVLVSADSSTATHVIFDDPIFCEAGVHYCICLVTASDKYTIWTSTLGELDKLTGASIISQPNTIGELFTSANSTSWALIQDNNLKFNLYTAQFETSGYLTFNDVNISNISKLLLAANYLTPQNTSCVWSYRTNLGNWMPLNTFQDIDLAAVSTKIGLKLNLQNSSIMSPILTTDQLNLIGLNPYASANYLTKTATLDQPYTSVTQILDVCTPANTSVKVFFSKDGGTTWVEQTVISSTLVIDDKYTRTTWTTTGITGNPTSFKAKVVLASSSSLVRPKVKNFLNIIK